MGFKANQCYTERFVWNITVLSGLHPDLALRPLPFLRSPGPQDLRGFTCLWLLLPVHQVTVASSSLALHLCRPSRHGHLDMTTQLLLVLTLAYELDTLEDPAIKSCSQAPVQAPRTLLNGPQSPDYPEGTLCRNHVIRSYLLRLPHR